MAKRKSTGKRLRFAVFKRDAFTCQYCGSRPPDVVLVADHVVPACKGGETTIDNLITSCESCNQGKADTDIGDAAPRPDAEMLLLEAQQEIAEMKRFHDASVQREQALAAVMERLQDVWQDVSGLDWCPTDAMVKGLIQKYGPEITERAMTNVAHKLGTGYLKTWNNKWLPYLYGVARNMAEEVG